MSVAATVCGLYVEARTKLPRKETGFGNDGVQDQKRACSMLVRISPKEPRLSDLVDLEIEVDAEADVVIRPPAFGRSRR